MVKEKVTRHKFSGNNSTKDKFVDKLMAFFVAVIVITAIVIAVVNVGKNKNDRVSLSPVCGDLGCYRWDDHKENYYISSYKLGISGTSYYDDKSTSPFSCSKISNTVECQTTADGYTIGADVTLNGAKECVSGTGTSVAVLKGGVWDNNLQKCAASSSVLAPEICYRTRNYGIPKADISSCHPSILSSTTYNSISTTACKDYACALYNLNQDTRLNTETRNLVKSSCIPGISPTDLTANCKNWCYKGVVSCNGIEVADPTYTFPSSCGNGMFTGLNPRTTIQNCYNQRNSLTIGNAAGIITDTKYTETCKDYLCSYYTLAKANWKGRGTIELANEFRDDCAPKIGSDGQGFMDTLKSTCDSWNVKTYMSGIEENNYGSSYAFFGIYFPIVVEKNGDKWKYELRSNSKKYWQYSQLWVFSDNQVASANQRFKNIFQGWNYNKIGTQSVDFENAVYQNLLLGNKISFDLNYGIKNELTNTIIDIELLGKKGTSAPKTIARIRTNCQYGNGLTTIDKFDANGNFLLSLYSSYDPTKDNHCEKNALGYLINENLKNDRAAFSLRKDLFREGKAIINVDITDPRDSSSTKSVMILNVDGTLDYALKVTIGAGALGKRKVILSDAAIENL